MINRHHLGRLIELAFDYVSAETEQQANYAHNQAVKLAMSNTMWLDLVDHIKDCNSNNGNNYPTSWASALQFLSTKRAELKPSPRKTHRKSG